MNMWGIHAGSTALADSLFMDRGVIAVGWPDVGDLAVLGSDRESFRRRVRETHKGRTDQQVASIVGVLYRFVHDLKDGDLIVYPRRIDRTVRLGRVVGPYSHRPDWDAHYCNVRPCEWINERPRTAFWQTALQEIGSAITLFRIREHAEHFQAVFRGDRSDGPVEQPLPDLQVSVEDFIIRRLEHELKGAPLERFVKDLLEAMGYRCRLTKVSGDGGIDVEASRGPLGFEPPIVRAQVKSSTDNVSDALVKQLFGSVNQGEYALFVTLGGYTRNAIEFAKSKPNLSLVGGKEFVALILEHYESLGPSSKAVLPLKRSYVPDVEE